MTTSEIHHSFEHYKIQEDQAYQLSPIVTSQASDLFFEECNNTSFDLTASQNEFDGQNNAAIDQTASQNEFDGQNNAAIDQTASQNEQTAPDTGNNKQKKEQRKIQEAQQIIQDFQVRVDTKLEENKTEVKKLVELKKEVCKEMDESLSTIYGYQSSLLKEGPQWFYDKNSHKQDKIGKVYLYNKTFRKSVECSMRNFKELSVHKFYIKAIENLKGDLESINHKECCLNRNNLSKEEYLKLIEIIKSIVKKEDKAFFERINDLNGSLNEQNTINFPLETINQTIINLLTNCSELVRNLLEHGFGIEQIVFNTLNNQSISYLLRNYQPQQSEVLRDYVLSLLPNLTGRGVAIIRKAVIDYIQKGVVLRDYNLT